MRGCQQPMPSVVVDLGEPDGNKPKPGGPAGDGRRWFNRGQ